MVQIKLVGFHSDIFDLIENLSRTVGRDYRQFLVERDSGELYLEYPNGALAPENIKFIPRLSGASEDA